MFYFRQALAIARLDDDAIVAASLDKNAMLYGAVIWLVGQLLAFATGPLIAGTRGVAIRWAALFVNLFVLIAIDALSMLAQYGICHFLARSWFGARGTYVRVLRAMLMGSVVIWLAVIPYVGAIASALWSIAVMMMVFEEVDGIRRLQAFGLSAIVGLAFRTIFYQLFTAR